MRLILLSLLFITGTFCFGQPGYKLQFDVEGLRDTTAYLGYYMGESAFIRDTASVNNKGRFDFDGKQTLRQGIYFIALNKTPIFQFVVGSNQAFSMSTNSSDYIKNMRVTGDADNKLFFENMLFTADRTREADPLLKIIRDSTLSEGSKSGVRNSYTKIVERVSAYQDDLIRSHPATVTARILKAHKPLVVPDPPKKTDGALDSTFQLRWYREHFFDHFDLADEALIGLQRPQYQQKINEYLDRLFLQHPDSLMKATDFIIAKARRNAEAYKYAVWTCMVKFQTHRIMGMDEVYVNLYDKYFASGEMNFWANEKFRKTIKSEADRIRTSMLGRTGANLIMLDSDLKPKSMYDITNKYTILYFFNPDCYTCKQETPKLVNFYNEKKFDVEVFAVSSDTSMAKMKNYIKEMDMKWITVNGPRTYVGSYVNLYDAPGTPTLYVLDRQKNIIAKKIGVENLEDFLTQYEKIEKAKAAGKF